MISVLEPLAEIDRLRAENADLRTRLKSFEFPSTQGADEGVPEGFAGLDLVAGAIGIVGWWQLNLITDEVRASRKVFHKGQPAEAASSPLSAFIDSIHPDDRARVNEAIDRLKQTGNAFAEEYRPAQSHDGITWVFAQGDCTLGEDGRATLLSTVVIDISQRKARELRSEALVALGDRLRALRDIRTMAYVSAELLGRTLGATRAGFGLVDPEEELVHMQPDWRAGDTATLEGTRHFRNYGSFIDDLKAGSPVIIADVEADERTAHHAQALLGIGIRVLINLPIIERGRFVAVIFAHYDGHRDLSEEEIRFVRAVGDQARAAIARARAEEQTHFLNRELSHRLKNNIATVQAIVSQTLRRAPDLETARRGVAGRLQSLSRAHDILLDADNVDAATIGAVVRDLQAISGARHVHASGPSVSLGPPSVLALSLLLHELFSNAARFGALTVESGRVDISWRLDVEAGGSPELVFDWKESGGPAVTPPSTLGFGARLIERGLTSDGLGSVETGYPQSGFRLSIRSPLASLQ